MFKKTDRSRLASIFTRIEIFPIFLLLINIPFAGCSSTHQTKIGILTIRHDIKQKSIVGEILPIALLNEGVLTGGGSEFPSDCSILAKHSEFKPGDQYKVFFKGKSIEKVTTGPYKLASYHCSGLCVLGVDIKSPIPEGARGQAISFFNQTESFEGVIYHFIVLASGSNPQGHEFPLLKEIPNHIEEYLKHFCESQIPISQGSYAKTKLARVDLFRNAENGDMISFVNAIREEEEDDSILTAIVSFPEKSSPQVLFQFMGKEGKDGASPFYEFIGAVDIDGDNTAEIIATFHHYELHEFIIFKLQNGKYGIVHRGPEYGC